MIIRTLYVMAAVALLTMGGCKKDTKTAEKAGEGLDPRFITAPRDDGSPIVAAVPLSKRWSIRIHRRVDFYKGEGI